MELIAPRVVSIASWRLDLTLFNTPRRRFARGGQLLVTEELDPPEAG